MFVRLIGILVLNLLLGFSAFGKNVFSNSFVSFEMPDGWNCNQEQTEWVCRNNVDPKNEDPFGKQKVAVIILTAKEKGPTDSFDVYMQRLGMPINMTTMDGKMRPSQVVVKPEFRFINNLKWVEAMHFGSELPNYFTKYLATIKGNLAIVVTFSAHKDFFTKYQSVFFNSVRSLNVTASPGLVATSPGLGNEPSHNPFSSEGPNGGNTVNPAIIDEPLPLPEEGGSRKGLYLGLALLFAAIGGGILYYMRKKDE